MGQMLAILTVLNNYLGLLCHTLQLGLLCHTLQGAKHPGTAHQSEETNILTEEDEIGEKSEPAFTNTQFLADQQEVQAWLPFNKLASYGDVLFVLKLQ